jgi:hypothetical protein
VSLSWCVVSRLFLKVLPAAPDAFSQGNIEEAGAGFCFFAPLIYKYHTVPGTQNMI